MSMPVPLPLPRKMRSGNSAPQVDPHAPELPPRVTIAARKEQPCPKTNGLQEPKAGCNGAGPMMTHPGSDPSPNTKPQEAKSGINLTHLKKKFQKMRSCSEEHTYAEISEINRERQQVSGFGNTDGGSNKASENEYEELPEPSDKKPAPKPSISSDAGVTLSQQSMPSEYLPPPPFAPGY